MCIRDRYIACLDPIGEKPGSHEYSLTPKAYGQFLIDLFELWEIDLEKGRQPYIRQFENWVGILMGQMPEACDQRGFCNLQNVVEADGSVYPCDFYVLDNYRIGNLNEDAFDRVYEMCIRDSHMQFTTAGRHCAGACERKTCQGVQAAFIRKAMMGVEENE